VSAPGPWDEVCRALKWQEFQGHSCIDTLNRIWAKDPTGVNPRPLPVVSRQASEVTKESWGLDRLWNLIHELGMTDVPPRSTTPAVIVLRWDGVDYLIDGRRRINHWQRNADQGPHKVLVIHGRPA
jgi:hypothetical protein